MDYDKCTMRISEFYKILDIIAPDVGDQEIDKLILTLLDEECFGCCNGWDFYGRGYYSACDVKDLLKYGYDKINIPLDGKFFLMVFV